MTNFYNPSMYGYPYMQPNERNNSNNSNYNYQNLPSQLKQYAFVNGIEGAKAFPLMPNQTMLLMDADNPILYKKTSDIMGKSTLDYFIMTQATENQIRDMLTPKQPQYALKSDVDAISEKIDKLISTIVPKQEIPVEPKGE